MVSCDYCDEGLPKDNEGWHLRVDPDGYEPTQRIPCQSGVQALAATVRKAIEAAYYPREADPFEGIKRPALEALDAILAYCEELERLLSIEKCERGFAAKRLAEVERERNEGSVW